MKAIRIKKRGAPNAVPLGLRNSVRLAAPEPEVLQVIGKESQRKGTDKLSAQRIDRIIKAARSQETKRG